MASDARVVLGLPQRSTDITACGDRNARRAPRKSFAPHMSRTFQRCTKGLQSCWRNPITSELTCGTGCQNQRTRWPGDSTNGSNDLVLAALMPGPPNSAKPFACTRWLGLKSGIRFSTRWAVYQDALRALMALHRASMLGPSLRSLCTSNHKAEPCIIDQTPLQSKQCMMSIRGKKRFQYGLAASGCQG